MDYGKRLEELLEWKKIKPSKLAEMMGVSPSQVSQLMSGKRKPGRGTLEKLAEQLKIPIPFFTDPQLTTSDLDNIPHKLPVINVAACGEWKDVTDLDFPAGIADRYEYGVTKDPYAFYLIAAGDSMIGADIREGDLLLVEPRTQVVNNDIVLALSEKGKTIKKFQKKDHMIVLIPMNEKYSPIVLMPEEVERENMRFYKISKMTREV